ncbi:hypothetical protein AHF37_00294 [Paragonimus kellicotti]|nr:hypothetical protein AHF37_00294 [Paragonimus kellicotti]
MLQRFTSGIGNVKTREKFIRKEPRSMEEALGTARAYAAAANATGSSLDNTFGAMAISVAESKPTYEGFERSGAQNKENLALAKNSFWNKKQQIDESVDRFANELRVLSFKAFPANTLQERESFMLQRFTSGIGNVKTREKFIRKEPRSMEEALGTARAYAAAANATGSSLDNTFGAMAISVDESKPTYEGPIDQGRYSECVYCQRFGSAAQRCGHNPPLRFPRSRGYWPPFRGTSRGSIAPRGRSHRNVLFVPSVSCHNSHSLLLCSVGLNGCSALVILDTGAACTVVRSKFCPEIRPYHRELRTANGTVLQTKGSSR